MVMDRLKTDLSEFSEAAGKFRHSVLTEVLRLPAPDPLRETLRDVDRMVAKAQLELTKVINSLP